MAESLYYQLGVTEVAKSLGTDVATGLSGGDVTERLRRFGRNVLESKTKISPLAILLEQFKDFLIIILLVSAIVSILLGERVDGILILTIVAAVAVVGFLNEYKAERTIEALKRLVSLKTKVLRGGQVTEIDTAELVPGDIVLLDEGQKLPADIRLIEAVALETNEASLTGESMPVGKNVDPITKQVVVGDQRNMVFAGTVINRGRGKGIVTATANSSEIGKIAKLVDEAEEEETPMQVKLDRLGKQLGWGILAICAVVFVIIFFFDAESVALPLIRRLTFAFIAAVALAVAAIPEGLAFVVRISLALGARRMAKRKALIRRLPAVEALGSTDTICCDKTGTLTKGEMTVRNIWLPGRSIEVSGSGFETQGTFQSATGKVEVKGDLELLLRLSMLCNNSVLQSHSILGDPTEGALLVAAVKGGLDQAKVKTEYPRLSENPFSSERKLMSTVHKSGAKQMVAVKGAPEIVLQKCSHFMKSGKSTKLTQANRTEILEQNHHLAAGALRVLALAYKEGSGETDLTFVGLIGMMDPPRAEIKPTIAKITKDAGMTVIMITGDHIETAKAVAAEIGIIGGAITGQELDALSQEQFEDRVESYAIYARVSPEHKIRIVNALKKAGHQVAMTGDGVNDAPAIKAADIGIAMGITGTDVAKEAADVILLDDHFLTIVSAIEEGRGIFDNVRKFVNYLLSCNIAEVLIVLSGVIIFKELALTAIQLLFINIVTDGLPAVALGSDPAERDIMSKSPRRFQGDIANRRLWIEMFVFGAAMTVIVIGLFAWDQSRSGLNHALAVSFTATVILEMVRLIGLRSDYKIGWLSNPWLIFAVFSSIVLQLAVIYVPAFAGPFKSSGIVVGDWMAILGGGVALILLMKLIKTILVKLLPDVKAKLPA